MSPENRLDDIEAFRDVLSDFDPTTAEAVQSVMDFESQDMVEVFRNTTEELRMTCLMRPEDAEIALGSADFDFGMDSGRPGIVGRGDGSGGMTYAYEGVESGGIAPLLHYRSVPERFGGSVVELAEDFRLFWNLYEDRERGQFLATDDVGDVVVVGEWRGDALLVRKSYLRRYQAARQLSLSIQVVLTRHGGDELAHARDARVSLESEDERFDFHGGSHTFGDDGHYTRLIGKRVLSPPPVEKSGVWPYEEAKEYEDFIIGLDAEGNPTSHTSDPEQLSNYFGANPGSPHYLTPVFLDRAVLNKYYGDPDRYEVRDGQVFAADAWSLSVDNALEDHVVVFLGDLGRDLPTREQRYWKAYNVPPAGEMSETAYRRSFLAEFHDSDAVEYRLEAAYRELNDAWEDRFGWALFKAPHEDDEHVLSVRVPTNESMAQLDGQIVPLAKLAVDFINESEISASLEEIPPGAKGITKLELFLEENGLPERDLCSVLRRIQGARSRSAAHRKGEDFDRDVLLGDSANPQALFRDILEALVAALHELRSAV